MNKREVQKRISQYGKKLALSKFSWDEKTKTFSSEENDLVIDFEDQNYCTFKTGSYCTFKTGSYCTFKTSSYCTFDTGSNCTFDTSPNCTFDTDSYCTFGTGYGCTFGTGSDCTFDTGSDCTFDTDSYCAFNTGSDCTFDTGSDCAFNTGSNCTFDTDYNCTFGTGADCTFDTGSNCTFKTSSNCTFEAGYDCTFKTGSGCILKTGSYCTFKVSYDCIFETGYDCVIVNRSIFEVIIPNKGDVIQICPYGTSGHLKNGIHSETGKESVIADGILSEIKTERTTKDLTIYRVVNYGESKVSYLIKRDDLYSHGKTLKEAKESLKYKISDRDTSKYNSHTLATVLTEVEAIEMYRIITGACESGVRYFVENLEDKPEKLTVKELIELTKERYNNNKLVEFFKKGA